MMSISNQSNIYWIKKQFKSTRANLFDHEIKIIS
jgi:hypothetical protein